MNILRNFEAVFVVALGLACAASYTLDSTMDNTNYATPAMAAASNMQVVVVSAKRLSPEQKQAMQEGARPAALATGNTRSSTASKI